MVASYADCVQVHPLLGHAYEKIYQPLHLSITHLLPEKESQEYCAHTFNLNNLQVKFRVAHITPTKTGQFVTLWKREKSKSPIKPYDKDDLIDLVIVAVQKEAQAGLFVFPASVLISQGIFASAAAPGKRAFRVYPPWDKAPNAQAKSSQGWQLNFFIDLSAGASLDLPRIQQLHLV